MTTDQVTSTILSIIGQIAPEITLDTINPHARLQEETDIDSMDFLRIVVAINDQLGVNIPEADYGEVATLDGMIRYVLARMR